MASAPTIFVTGATGTQGGSAVDSLLSQGFAVRALVRDLDAASARALAARSVVLVQGDFDDEDGLERCMTGAAGVFSVQLPPTPADPERELRTGRKLIDAARKAGIDAFVHSSVARAGDQHTFVGWNEGRWWPDYWDGKAGVNAMVRSAGFAHWTILKPAYMMDNFARPKSAGMFPNLVRGTLDTAMNTRTKLDLIAGADIGHFVAASFADPARFGAQEIDLAAESLTMCEVAEILSDVSARSIVARHLTADEAIAAGNHAGLVQSQCWASVEGYKVDLAEAASYGIALERFRNWAARNRDRLRFQDMDVKA